MDLDSGGAMNRSDFEEALSRAVAREPLIDTGTVPFNVALQEVAASAPDSDARADAIEVARLVFDQLDPEHDGIPWNGPACPACGTEMNVEIMPTSKGLKGCQRCPQCDLALLIPDVFAK
jgi:tRNA(Ile2) C34 agmatinyltransferase TiaS